MVKIEFNFIYLLHLIHVILKIIFHGKLHCSRFHLLLLLLIEFRNPAILDNQSKPFILQKKLKFREMDLLRIFLRLDQNYHNFQEALQNIWLLHIFISKQIICMLVRKQYFSWKFFNWRYLKKVSRKLYIWKLFHLVSFCNF